MGVYIPDMKLPSSCLMCDIPVRVQPCPVDHDNVSNYKTSRHPACPLLPVPEHGRLGDLDALAGQFTPDDLYYPTEEDRRDYDNHSISMRDAREVIEMAPTIIPADQI